MIGLVETLLHGSDRLSVRDIVCDGACRHKSPSECSQGTHFVLPYAGAFARHVGRGEALGDVNQLLFFNHGEEYCISHPGEGGDACLSIAVADDMLVELAARDRLAPGQRPRFHRQGMGIDPRVQLLGAQLRYRLQQGAAEPLEVEGRVFALLERLIGRPDPVRPQSRDGCQKIVQRAKRVLATDPARRWTSDEIGGEVGVSPVYLTQLFQRVEGVPLYRYALRLRLARALALLPGCRDLTGLALDLGFSSHSHFTAAFRRTYGESPRAFQRAAGLR